MADQSEAKRELGETNDHEGVKQHKKSKKHLSGSALSSKTASALSTGSTTTTQPTSALTVTAHGLLSVDILIPSRAHPAPSRAPTRNKYGENIETPHVHDVLCGRGGLTNKHAGNRHWRRLVNCNKGLYCALQKKSQKQQLSKTIVRTIRTQDPPGRFLKRDNATNLWSDIGDAKAQEKTSQALREGAPEFRQHSKERERMGLSRASARHPTLLSVTTTMPPPLLGVQVSRPNGVGHVPPPVYAPAGRHGAPSESNPSPKVAAERSAANALLLLNNKIQSEQNSLAS